MSHASQRVRIEVANVRRATSSTEARCWNRDPCARGAQCGRSDPVSLSSRLVDNHTANGPTTVTTAVTITTLSRWSVPSRTTATPAKLPINHSISKTGSHRARAFGVMERR